MVPDALSAPDVATWVAFPNSGGITLGRLAQRDALGCRETRTGAAVVGRYNPRVPPSTFRMSHHRVFIDGQVGTTGLELASRLQRHGQIELLTIEERLRKDAARRCELIARADAVVLCLPDTAAREAVELVPGARVLDASTAHRTSEGWVYGLPELVSGQRQAIRSAGPCGQPRLLCHGFRVGRASANRRRPGEPGPAAARERGIGLLGRGQFHDRQVPGLRCSGVASPRLRTDLEPQARAGNAGLREHAAHAAVYARGRPLS